MQLNEIFITGATYQKNLIHQEDDPNSSIDKSIQAFFRNRRLRQLLELISTIFEKSESQENYIQEELTKPDHRIFPKISESRRDKSRKSYDSIGFHELPTPKIRISEQDREPEPARETERLLEFDSELFYYLYKKTFPQVAHVIISEGGDQHLARDIFQNALIILLERSKTENFKLTCSPGTYIHAVSINIWRNLQRTKAYNVIEFEISDYSEILKETLYFEEIPQQYEKVAFILDKMGDPCKSLLESFYFNQLPYEAIAEKFGYSNAASARNQKYKCLERIRKEFE